MLDIQPALDQFEDGCYIIFQKRGNSAVVVNGFRATTGLTCANCTHEIRDGDESELRGQLAAMTAERDALQEQVSHAQIGNGKLCAEISEWRQGHELMLQATAQAIEERDALRVQLGQAAELIGWKPVPNSCIQEGLIECCFECDEHQYCLRYELAEKWGKMRVLLGNHTAQAAGDEWRAMQTVVETMRTFADPSMWQGNWYDGEDDGLTIAQGALQALDALKG